MNKKRAAIAAVLLVAAVGAFSWMVLRAPVTPEPEYEGEKLSELLGMCYSTNPVRSVIDMSRAQNVIAVMGTNAVPYLMQMLRSRDSDLKPTLLRLVRKMRLTRNEPVPEAISHMRALIGLRVIGENASNAVPELVQLYDRDPSPQCKRRIVEVLGSTHAQPELAVPLLIRALQEKDPYFQISAVIALGNFKMDARTAIPALTKFLEANLPPPQPKLAFTSGISLYDVGLDSLRKIDPDAAAKLLTNSASLAK